MSDQDEERKIAVSKRPTCQRESEPDVRCTERATAEPFRVTTDDGEAFAVWLCEEHGDGHLAFDEDHEPPDGAWPGDTPSERRGARELLKARWKI